MRIVVAGIGGVGGYIGAHLARTQTDVTFLARGSHAETIRQEGLNIQEDTGSFSVKPALVTTAEALEGEIDLLLLCVKSYHIESLIKTLTKNITASTIIIPFSNGVEHKANIERLIDAKVLFGAVYILAHKERDGLIVKKGKVFAALFGNQNYPQETTLVSELFTRANLRHKTPQNIEEGIWKKYLFISTFGALTSYFDTTMREVYTLHKNWAETLLNEVADIAEAKGLNLREEVPKALEVASSLPKSASSSMHLDFQNGNQTELETLCGYIVKEGKRLRVPTPMMAKVYGVLKQK